MTGLAVLDAAETATRSEQHRVGWYTLLFGAHPGLTLAASEAFVSGPGPAGAEMEILKAEFQASAPDPWAPILR